MFRIFTIFSVLILSVRLNAVATAQETRRVVVHSAGPRWPADHQVGAGIQEHGRYWGGQAIAGGDPAVKSGLLTAQVRDWSLYIDKNEAGAIPRDGETLYYSGYSVVTRGEDVERKPYLIARTLNAAASTISEVAISYQQGAFKENSSVLKVEGRHFFLSESTGTVKGQGELTGRAWEWTFLRAEFRVEGYPLRIVDFNSFDGARAISGHKDFYRPAPDGRGEVLAMEEDVQLRAVTREAFEEQRSELLK